MKIKNLKICFLSVCVALFLSVPTAFASEFVDGIEDVPVMENVEQTFSQNVSFGNNETRFVEAYFSAKKESFAKVSHFYEETLPQLGWKFIEKGKNHLTFERDCETLDIVEEKQSPLLFRITLKSKN